MARDVSAVIWNWREAGPGGRLPSGRQQLRRAALIQATVMAGVGALLYFGLGHHLIGTIVWGLGGLSLLLGLVHPHAFRPLHRFGQWLGRVVGQLLVYVLLVPFYYLFFFPVSLLLRLQGRDPMHHRFRPADVTYWIPHRHAAPPGIYERQFLKEDPRARGMRRPVGSLPEPSEQERT